MRLTNAGRRVRVRLVTSGHMEPDVASANVVGEISGRERPDEIVLVGGHLDSWDVGTGASDDGAGCIVTWEALRLMKKLGSGRGAPCGWSCGPTRSTACRRRGLRRAYAGRRANHVLALESDSGVFAPATLGFTGSLAAPPGDGADRHAAGAARDAGHRGRWRRGRHRSDRRRRAMYRRWRISATHRAYF